MMELLFILLDIISIYILLILRIVFKSIVPIFPLILTIDCPLTLGYIKMLGINKITEDNLIFIRIIRININMFKWIVVWIIIKKLSKKLKYYKYNQKTYYNKKNDYNDNNYKCNQKYRQRNNT